MKFPDKIFNRTPTLIYFILISAALIILNLVRIEHVPVTYDEASSHLHAPYEEFINMDYVTANNHILNSVVRKYFLEEIWESDFYLRLGNLITQIFYLIFGILVCTHLFKSRRWQIGTFILLNFNPFLFEFWGLSRGYGMAIGLMMTSIYFLFLHFRKNNLIFLYLSLLFAIFSVYSNFTLLNYYEALLAAVFIQTFFFRPIPRFSTIMGKAGAVILATLQLYNMIALPIERLRKDDQLFFGGHDGVFNDTLVSLLKETLYSNDRTVFITILAYVVTISIFASAIYWLQLYLRKKTDEQAKKGMLLCVLFLIPIISIKFQHHFLNVRYLIERTALFLMVLYFLHISFWLYYISGKTKKNVVSVLFAVVCVFSVFNFCKNMTIDSTRTWSFNKYDLVMLERVMELSKNKPAKIKLRTKSLFCPSVGHDVTMRYPECFELIEYIDPPPNSNDTGYDFFYVAAEDTAAVPSRFVVDTSFGDGKYFLMRRADTSSYSK